MYSDLIISSVVYSYGI